MSSHPPFRLRLTLAFLILAVAGTAIGGATLLGSNQDDPTATADGEQLAVTGPPLVPEVPLTTPSTSQPAVEADPGMRLGVLDKDEARREERQARADARALRALADQQAAAFEFAAALDEADQAAADAAAVADLAPTGPPATPEPPPTTAAPGGGGGNNPPPPPNHDDDPLYVKLDNIATCESNQNEDAVSPDRRYWGAFQFLFETWQSYGGGGSRPRDILGYSYNAQREIAANLARARGFAGSWPACAARYGYS